ncbi:hypothetical protein J4Q44_G00022530 [Coregonus suidteri]|uniref:C2H2-type domain-containing protein n=1 Tax=Coregonus suidteri TaxID=861788 RepID=A0AAN8M9C8_9TELE
MEMAAEDIVIQETLGAEVELLEDVNKAHKQSPPEIPRVSVPCPFSMPEDSSDDDCDLSGDSVSAYAVALDHTYSMESNGRVTKTRHRLEESEEEEDVKPDPSILTPSLRIRVKLERGVEVDGAPLQWDEGMSDGEGSEHSEDTESAGGTDNDRLTESSGETDIDEEDIRLSEEEEEMKSKQGEDRKNDIQSEKEDEDAEMLIDQDGEPSSSERESEFDPEELSDSDSGSSSSGESSGSSYTPVRTRNVKTRPSRTKRPRTKLPQTKLSQVRPYYCIYCAKGPYHNMDFHVKSCNMKKDFQCSLCQAVFPTEMAMLDHEVRTHSEAISGQMYACEFCRQVFPDLAFYQNHNCPKKDTPPPYVPDPSTYSETPEGTCIHCGRGPFSSLDIHLRTCSGKKGFKCFVCNVFFPTETALADHKVLVHSIPSETPEQGTCDHCGIGPFTNLDNHMKTCSKRKCIQCSVCKFFFPSDVLANHMISYHSTKSRVQSPVTETHDKGACVHCGRGPFTSLEHHMKYCNKQKGIQCVMCKAYFLTEGSLVDHIVLAHADKLVTQAGGSSATTFSFVPMAISTTSGQQSPSSPTLMCYSSGVKELKRLAPVPVADQGPSAVGQLTPVGQSTVSLPRVMLSTTTSSPSYSQPAVPVMATLLFDNTGGGPGKMARLVPVAPQTNPPKPQVTAPTQTNTAKPLGQFCNLLQQAVQQPTPRPTALAMDPIRSLTPITPSPRPVSASAPGQITMIRLSPVPTPLLAQSSPLTLTLTPAPLSIMCMFVNRSKELALEKRMKMSWRSKGTYTCRQCGAISQQPSLNVKHRYLHRGSRRYRCHCGRSFLRRLHLLRHYHQHAQATRYICTACGETFDGAKCLAQHMVGASNATRCPGDSLTLKPRKECRMPFSCHCGQVFCRPAAFLWHKLKNTQRT